MKNLPKAAVIMGSKSDYEVVKPCIAALKKFGVGVEARVMSAHRTPDAVHAFAADARRNGFGVIVAAAGKAAHLAGVLAAATTLPVIGLPVQTSLAGGLDSLLSTVQMPSGVPVACVGVNAGENAGLLAVQILSAGFIDLAEKLDAFKADMAKRIAEDDAELQKLLQ
ncbi:MAG: 5-(carboxyamino)imidazole ribonucleotide mutase [Clostridiales bacterium]|jgi:5-(carboxyamino)imidazole ribonucleotide mutase|nr:5-(carboxyamino)imidazole ribonucleotide mutase [Clostridiales bacterium]